jgi:hypothetical protein
MDSRIRAKLDELLTIRCAVSSLRRVSEIFCLSVCFVGGKMRFKPDLQFQVVFSTLQMTGFSRRESRRSVTGRVSMPSNNLSMELELAPA